MSDVPPPSPPRANPASAAHRSLFVIVVTVAVTALGLGLVGLVCAYAVPPIVHDAAFDAKSTVLEGFFYAGQPAKTAGYQTGAVALPFLLAFGFWAGWRWVKTAADETVKRINVAGLVLYLALMVGCGVPIVYCPHPPFWILPPSWLILPFTYSRPFYSPVRMLLLLAAAAFEFYLLSRAPSRRSSRLVTGLLLVLAVLFMPSRLYVPSEISDDLRFLYHFNCVLDALAQAVNGHDVLVDFPHIYGCYVQLLAPLLRLLPRDPQVIIPVLALPDILGRFCLLILAALVVRRPAVLFLCGLTLLIATMQASADDINYSFVTSRFLFPPMALLAGALFFRQPGPGRYAVTTAFVALAPIWNLDTGVALVLSWLATLVISAAAARDFRAVIGHAVIQFGAGALAWGAFLLYLRATSGQWPEIGELFYFPRFIVDTGYFCLPMLFPDMWVFVLSLYVMALAFVLAAYVRRTDNWTTPVTLLLALYGVASFSYFMGRSAPSNLLAVAYPAVIIAGMLCSKAEILLQRRKLPPMARFFLLPTRLALFWWSFLMVAAIPDFLHQSAHVIRHWNDTGATPFRLNSAFVRAQTHPHEDGVFFLSNNSGFFYYQTQTARPVRLPGNVELLQSRDMNALIADIEAKKFRKLFVEENFFDIQMYRPDVYDRLRAAIAQNYRVEQTGPTGKLVLYAPQ